MMSATTTQLHLRATPAGRGGPLCARLTLAAALAVAALFVLPGVAVALEQKLVASDGAAEVQLGDSVAVDGDTAVVGAPFDEAERGAVYVFTRAGDSWTQTAKLTASDGATGDLLGVSVAIDGDTIVAGASDDDVGVNVDQGSVSTFARSGAAERTQTARLTTSDGAADDRLGRSVAIDGDTIVAGAARDDVGVNVDQGSVYTFVRSGAAERMQTARLTASDGAADDLLGFSVAIDGDTIVAGALFGDVGVNVDQGSAYTFARSGDATRTQTARLTASDGAANDRLGRSVAIAGDTIVAGASDDDVGANADQGSASIFFQAAPVIITVPPAPLGGGGGGVVGQPPFAAKLEVARARVLSAARRLDVLAPITARASGRVRVSFLGAGRTERFTAAVDSRNARVRISRRIAARQARLGTGILTLAYPGDADTQPQEVRLRAASRAASLVAGRPKISGGRLMASGRISSRARGVVRLQLLFEPAGQGTRTLRFTARIAGGRYRVNRALPADVLAQIAGRRGVVHSYTLFTGYQPARMRGEMASFQVLAER